MKGNVTPETIPARDPASFIHISSAVIMAFPERCDAIVREINAMPLTEVRHVEGGKIVIVLEDVDSGAIGARLLSIAALEGVLSANMVYEHRIESDESE